MMSIDAMDVGQRGDPLYTRDCLTDGQRGESLALITALVVQQNEKQKKLSEKRSHGIIHQQGKKSIMLLGKGVVA